MNVQSTDVSWLLEPVTWPLILLWSRIWCSDGVPLFGYWRGSYLVFCGLFGAHCLGVSWLHCWQTINLLQPLWFFSVHYLLHFADVVSFITSFGSMLWLLVSLIPAQFGTIPDFFEGFFHLFQTLHWYHLHDSAKEQVFVGLFGLVGGWIMKLVYGQWVSGWVWNLANEILLESEVRNHANRFSQMKD